MKVELRAQLMADLKAHCSGMLSAGLKAHNLAGLKGEKMDMKKVS
jgi:hypothetical protein